MRILATSYRAKHASGFSAYMALQAALMQRYLRRGGTIQQWCARLAPAFRRRYAPELLNECGDPERPEPPRLFPRPNRAHRRRTNRDVQVVSGAAFSRRCDPALRAAAPNGTGSSGSAR
jgi:hypothetical protein